MSKNRKILPSVRFWLAIAVVAGLGAVFVSKSSTVAVLVEELTPPKLPAVPPVQATLHLDQNWSDETRTRFHHISQGTSTFPVPLPWLMALEQPEASPLGLLRPGANPLFFENDYLRRFGFIPSQVSPDNPNSLPIGFASTTFQTLPGISGNVTSLGLTCSACHTGHFTYEGTQYVVDGGPSTVDLQGFSSALVAALGQTALSSALPVPNRRFERFARKVLGETYTQTARARLKADLASALEAAPTDQFNVVEGHGRLDALNRIGNQVFSENLERPQNYTPITAPVNYPHIWTAMWFDWVQYDGSIMQPLVRNAGEALGVHAHINTTAPPGEGRFSSAVEVGNLTWIENKLSGTIHPEQERKFGGLHGPTWPDALPPVDTALRDKGAQLYDTHCAGCHLPALDSDKFWDSNRFRKIPYRLGGAIKETELPYLALNLIPLTKLGTDPAQSQILKERTVDTAANSETGAEALGLDTVVCVPRKSPGGGKSELVPLRVTDGPSQSFALALGAVVQQANNAWFDNALIPDDQRAEFEGGRPNCLRATSGYKARPLNGVWATAPFLHNGSVPTLDDLLRPADERPRFVRLGATEFDPVKVGLQQPELPNDHYPAYVDGYFILDTALPGNRNTGHAFGPSADGDATGVIGPNLSDDDRGALKEFLKSY